MLQCCLALLAPKRPLLSAVATRRFQKVATRLAGSSSSLSRRAPVKAMSAASRRLRSAQKKLVSVRASPSRKKVGGKGLGSGAATRHSRSASKGRTARKENKRVNSRRSTSASRSRSNAKHRSRSVPKRSSHTRVRPAAPVGPATAPTNAPIASTAAVPAAIAPFTATPMNWPGGEAPQSTSELNANTRTISSVHSGPPVSSVSAPPPLMTILSPPAPLEYLLATAVATVVVPSVANDVLEGMRHVVTRAENSRNATTAGPSGSSGNKKEQTIEEYYISSKGPLFATAVIAGTNAVKLCSTLLPLCHPVGIQKCSFTFRRRALSGKVRPSPLPHRVVLRKRTTPPPTSSLVPGQLGTYSIIYCFCTVATSERKASGVEMEALTGATVAATTMYDMLRHLPCAQEDGLMLGESFILAKRGGRQDFVKLLMSDTEPPPIPSLPSPESSSSSSHTAEQGKDRKEGPRGEERPASSSSLEKTDTVDQKIHSKYGTEVNTKQDDRQHSNQSESNIRFIDGAKEKEHHSVDVSRPVQRHSSADASASPAKLARIKPELRDREEQGTQSPPPTGESSGSIVNSIRDNKRVFPQSDVEADESSSSHTIEVSSRKRSKSLGREALSHKRGRAPAPPVDPSKIEVEFETESDSPNSRNESHTTMDGGDRVSWWSSTPQERRLQEFNPRRRYGEGRLSPITLVQKKSLRKSPESSAATLASTERGSPEASSTAANETERSGNTSDGKEERSIPEAEEVRQLKKKKKKLLKIKSRKSLKRAEKPLSTSPEEVQGERTKSKSTRQTQKVENSASIPKDDAENNEDSEGFDMEEEGSSVSDKGKAKSSSQRKKNNEARKTSKINGVDLDDDTEVVINRKNSSDDQEIEDEAYTEVNHDSEWNELTTVIDDDEQDLQPKKEENKKVDSTDDDEDGYEMPPPREKPTKKKKRR